MNQRHTELDALAIGGMVLLSAIWGLNQVSTKIANAGISPLLQAGLRSVGALAMLWAWSYYRRVPLLRRDGALLPGIAVGLLFAVEFGVMYWGLNYTTASRAIVFLYTAPFVVALGMHWFVPSERLTLWQGMGLVCAFAGTVVAFGDGLFAPAGPYQWLGDSMLLMSGIIWGATTIMIRTTRLVTVSANKVLFYQLAVSAIVLPAASLAVGEPGFTHPVPLAWLALVWQILVVAFASYLGWFWLITRYPAAKLSAYSFLTPIFGLVFGAVLLGEHVSASLLLAMAMVAAGIFLVSRKRPV